MLKKNSLGGVLGGGMGGGGGGVGENIKNSTQMTNLVKRRESIFV